MYQTGKIIFFILLFVVCGYNTRAQQTAPVCFGQTKKLIASSPDAQSYQWFKNGIPIPGALTATLIINESATYNVVCTDANGCISDSSISVYIIPARPIGIDDVTQTVDTVSVHVLSNDISPCAPLNTATVTITKTPDNGTVTINSGGVVFYTANATFSGTDSFEYTVADMNGTVSNVAAVYILVNNPPLPVTLLSFTAKKQQQISLLQWQTENEVNFSHFEISRSHNGIEWTTIGKVPATTSTSAINNYKFVDQSPLEGNNFYRLIMRDRDNTFTYSRIQIVYFEPNTWIKLSPNPVTDNLNITWQNRNITHLQCYDITGRLIYQQTVNNNRAIINMHQYTAGIYMIRLTQDNGTIHSYKIVKQ